MAMVDVSSGAMYYYLNDRLGTPQLMTDSTNTVVWQAIYKPFGEAALHPQSSVVNNFRFPGQYYDKETGLHYNYHRYYDPRTGRYLRPDPIGLAGGTNLYIYSVNNPINEIDPRGLDAVAGTLTASAIFAASSKGSAAGIAALVTGAGSVLAVGTGTFLATTALLKYTPLSETWFGRGGIGEWIYDLTHPDDNCAFSARHDKDVIDGLLKHAAIHAEKIASIPPNGPNDDERKWKKEVKAALERAKRIAQKRLKGKTRANVLQQISKIAEKANISI